MGQHSRLLLIVCCLLWTVVFIHYMLVIPVGLARSRVNACPPRWSTGKGLVDGVKNRVSQEPKDSSYFERRSPRVSAFVLEQMFLDLLLFLPSEKNILLLTQLRIVYFLSRERCKLWRTHTQAFDVIFHKFWVFSVFWWQKIIYFLSPGKADNRLADLLNLSALAQFSLSKYKIRIR